MFLLSLLFVLTPKLRISDGMFCAFAQLERTPLKVERTLEKEPLQDRLRQVHRAWKLGIADV
jgi:hypothetical protein